MGGKEVGVQSEHPSSLGPVTKVGALFLAAVLWPNGR